MTTDLDSILTDSLRTRADAGEAIDAAVLLRQATERGGRLRRRQRVLPAAAAAVAVCAGVTATVAIVAGAGSTVAHLRPSVSPATVVDLALLPTADGHPGAAIRPEVIGTDPNVLHFSVDGLTSTARRVDWSSEAGFETATVQRRDFQVHVALARTRDTLPTSPFSGGPQIVMSDPVEVSIDNRPATLRTFRARYVNGKQGGAYSFLWQPADGFWARVDVQNTSQQQTELILKKIRFDQARRCVVPFRLHQLPAGASVQGCTVVLANEEGTMPKSTGVFSSGGLAISDGRRQLHINALAMGVSDDYNAYAASPESGLRQLNAGQYEVFAEPNGRDWTMHTRGLLFNIGATSRKNDSYTEDEVLKVIRSLRLADQLTDPSTWPTGL